MRWLVNITSLFLSIILTTGCFFRAKEPLLVMHGDVSYTPIERECVDSSADTWREQTKGLADAKVTWDYDSKDPVSVHELRNQHRIIRWTSDHPIVKEFDGPDWQLLGLVNSLEGPDNNYSKPLQMHLVMDRLQDRHTCRLTAIHELGHVFGVPHLTNYQGNIMYPSVDNRRTDCLKYEDLLVYCFENSCGNVQVKACEQDESDFATGSSKPKPPSEGFYRYVRSQ